MGTIVLQNTTVITTANMKLFLVAALLIASACAEPESEGEAKPWLAYGNYGYNYPAYGYSGYAGYPYTHGYRHFWKRDTESEAEPEAKPDAWYSYYGNAYGYPYANGYNGYALPYARTYWLWLWPSQLCPLVVKRCRKTPPIANLKNKTHIKRLLLCVTFSQISLGAYPFIVKRTELQYPSSFVCNVPEQYF